MKQTAIQWLSKELESFGDSQYCKLEWEKLDLLIKKAKTMEKNKPMSYEEFKKIIDLQIAHYKKIQDAYNLKIDLLEAFDEQEKVIDSLWKQVLTADGDDWLGWYLYEKDAISGKPRKDLDAHDGDVEICKDLKGLYDYLSKQKYFKV